METEFVQLPFETIEVDSEALKIPKAKAFAQSLQSVETSALISCSQIVTGDGMVCSNGDEVVTFDTRIDVGPRPVNDIRYTERIAILFTANDKMHPWVFALRNSFPEVLHRLQLPFQKPTCLCIYERDYEDLKIQWRPQRMLEDIRTWLSLTAYNKLHQEDQRLEQLLPFFQGRLILPHDIQPGDEVHLTIASQKPGQFNLVATKQVSDQPAPFLFLFLRGEKQEHGMKTLPLNLYQLHEFLTSAGIDLLPEIQVLIRPKTKNQLFLQKRLLLVVELPKSNEDGSREELDLYAFFTHDTMKEIGLKTASIEEKESILGFIFPFESAPKETSSEILIQILVPSFTLDRELANALSGYEKVDWLETAIVQIGLGALGSQLFINMAKAWLGKWTLIDKDILLPHNAVRHHLHQKHAGRPKSFAIAAEINAVLNDASFAVGVWEDYLNPTNVESLNQGLRKGDVILDVSTSIPVARHLAHRSDLPGRRVSMFLNPSGTDLVVLGEDIGRAFRLDAMEYQYYRILINDERLNHHLSQPGVVRYANSCRDITSQIPQDFVAMHAAIASAALKNLLTSGDPLVAIWQRNESFGVNVIKVPLAAFTILKRGEWSIYIDEVLVEKLATARLAKLPNETGGILIGGFDFERKYIYLVETVLSPKDSIETPTGYTPGKEGLKERVAEIMLKTAGNLVYAGEWHSHPIGCSLSKSEDDETHFADIRKNMTALGYPPLMVIAGDNKKIEIYLDEV